MKVVDPASLSVLHVVLSLNPGGAERSVIEIVSRLVDRMPTAVCCLEEAGAWGPELAGRGVEVVALHRRSGFRPSLGLEIADIARRIGATTLHCHQYTPFVYGTIAALRCPGLRVVFTEQGRLSDTPPSAKRRVVNQVLGRLPARMFAVSADLRRHMIAEGFPATRVGVIYNAIDGGSVPSADDRAEARRSLGLPDDAVVIGTAARLDPVKDLPTLVQAVGQVRLEVPTAGLVIIGEGPDRQRIEDAVRAQGLIGAVQLLGYRPDVRRLLAALDIYVNCSVSEGISLTILEAMASALPVVATRVGGNPEVVADGDTGLLVPARAPESLAAALTALSRTPEQRRALGAAGRRRMEALFAVDGMVDKYVRAYRGEVP